MSEFKAPPIPSGIETGLSSFLVEVKKRIDILGGDTTEQLVTKQDLIDIGILNFGHTVHSRKSYSVDKTISEIMTILTVGGSGKPSDLPFISGEIGGIKTVGLNGNLIIDGSIIARNIAAGSITADIIATGTLLIGNFDTTTTDRMFTSDSRLYSDISGGPPTNADNTQSALNVGAAIDSAMANGSTFISGGYINTDIVKVNSSLIIGNLDWSTQIAGTGKPDNYADQTSANTANNTNYVGTTPASYISGWQYPGTTYINGGDIYAGSLTVSRLSPAIGTITFTSGTMNFANGADLVMQSTTNDRAIIEFQHGSYKYKITTSVNGSAFGIVPTYGSPDMYFGDPVYTNIATLNGSNFAVIRGGAITSTYGEIVQAQGFTSLRLFGSTFNYINYYFIAGSFSPVPYGTYGAPTLGSATNSWSAFYTVNATIGGATHESDFSMHVKGIGSTSSTYSIVAQNSSSVFTFYVDNTGNATLAGNLTENSKAEYKENIVGITQHIMPKILQLSGIEYNLKTNPGKTTAGYLYEDILPIFPLLATNRMMKNPKANQSENFEEGEPVDEFIEIGGLTYTRFIPYMVKGMQEQQVYIDSLADRLENLESEQLIKEIL